MFISRSLLVIAGVAQTYAATYVAQFSPTFTGLPTPTGVATSYPSSGYDTSSSLEVTTLSGFPTVDQTAPTTSAEVVAAYNSVNWDYVPAAPVRKLDSNGDIVFTGYSASDPYCWWSYSNCVKPKVTYLPGDFYNCPTVGQWGLSYDDGPLTPDNADVASYAEPTLYNFLVEHNQKATLFVCHILYNFLFVLLTLVFVSILVEMLLASLKLPREVSMTETISVFTLGLTNL
jgi:hypothetical protein